MTAPAGNVRLTWAIAAVAVLAIAGAAVGGEFGANAIWLHYVCKPLATLLLLVLAWRAVLPVSLRYRLAISLGIAASLAGDVFLMLPDDLFLQGLISFLVAHGCFLVALCSDVKPGARLVPPLACLLFGAGNVAVLWKGIAPALHGPVIVYVIVLTLMAGQAIARGLVKATSESGSKGADRAAWDAARGAVLFMLSDTLLAYDRFGGGHGGVVFERVLILGSYYLALWFLARSVDQSPDVITSA